MKKWILSILLSFFMLTGCWDMLDTQDIQYITAIGIDYEDGEYIVYVQSLNFGHLSVIDTSNSSNENPGAWVGKAKGETILLALDNLYPKTNQEVHWGHVNAIVYSENVLDFAPLIEINEALYRYQQIRVTPWVFATNDNISDILLVTNMFGDSVHTELFDPDSIFKERSYIEPIALNQLMRDYPEFGRSVKLPNIDLVQNEWHSSNGKTNNALNLNGAYILKGGKKPVYYNENELSGLRWLKSKTSETPLLIKENGKKIALLNIIRPEAHIASEVDGTQVYYDVKIKGTAALQDFPPSHELGASKKINELTQLLGEEMEEQIRATYLLGLKSDKDVYDLENIFYRQHVKAYKSLPSPFQLNETSLRSIKVDIQIGHTGEYEFYRDRVPRSEQGK
ncbi:Ger(x)C family spore germination protein [Shouchella patagoniensis]|uniref:Ger(x)C family spore germination protein n=1 Tax=Shouchella patagoniensis TaxID=228576 RepID=UPI000994F846|nr:Ger(x)C family spore germination protein [Shouchella patagoniensis]